MKEPIAATFAAASAPWLTSANDVLTILVTLLTLAWWIRLWWKQPGTKPPWIKDDNFPPGAAVALLLVLLILMPGCATNRISLFETGFDAYGPYTKETNMKAKTIFEAKSELAKLHTTATDKTQSISLSGLSQSATASNLVPVVKIVFEGLGAAAGAAVK